MEKLPIKFNFVSIGNCEVQEKKIPCVESVVQKKKGGRGKGKSQSTVGVQLLDHCIVSAVLDSCMQRMMVSASLT